MRNISVFALVLALHVTRMAHSASPAAEFCEAARSSSIDVRVRAIIEFSDVIRRSLEYKSLEEHEAACVQRRISDIEAEIQEYCESRNARGNDFAVSELSSLQSKLELLDSDCEIEDSKAFEKRLNRIKARECSELEDSYRAFAELVEQPPRSRPEMAKCVLENIPSVVPPVQSMCDRREISVRSAWVEISERLSPICFQEDVTGRRITNE